MSLSLELHFVFDCIVFGILISGASLILVFFISYSYCQPALHYSFITLNLLILWISP